MQSLVGLERGGEIKLDSFDQKVMEATLAATQIELRKSEGDAVAWIDSFLSELREWWSRKLLTKGSKYREAQLQQLLNSISSSSSSSSSPPSPPAATSASSEVVNSSISALPDLPPLPFLPSLFPWLAGSPFPPGNPSIPLPPNNSLHPPPTATEPSPSPELQPSSTQSKSMEHMDSEVLSEWDDLPELVIAENVGVFHSGGVSECKGQSGVGVLVGRRPSVETFGCPSWSLALAEVLPLQPKSSGNARARGRGRGGSGGARNSRTIDVVQKQHKDQPEVWKVTLGRVIIRVHLPTALPGWPLPAFPSKGEVSLKPRKRAKPDPFVAQSLLSPSPSPSPSAVQRQYFEWEFERVNVVMTFPKP